jgi:hypothetical protein
MVCMCVHAYRGWTCIWRSEVVFLGCFSPYSWSRLWLGLELPSLSSLASHLAPEILSLLLESWDYRQATQPASQPPTHPPSQPATHPPTHPPSQPPTHPPTQSPSHPPTQSPSHPPAHPASHPPTHPHNQPPSHPATQPPSHPATQPASQPATQPASFYVGVCDSNSVMLWAISQAPRSYSFNLVYWEWVL